MKAHLIAIGSELLRGDFPDTLGDYLARQLESLGWKVVGRQIVPDDEARISRAITERRGPTQAVLLTGGLGPTLDDRTREGIARSLERELGPDPVAQRDIVSWCRRKKLTYGSRQRKQALLPRGARAIRNPLGSAPGIWYRDRGGLLVALPGVPAELRAMFAPLRATLRRLGKFPRPSAELVITGMGESQVDRRLSRYSRFLPEVEVITLAQPGEVRVLLRGASRTSLGQVARFESGMREELGVNLVSRTGESLEEVVLRLLKRRRLTLATAESCTAGLISTRLTSIPGASSGFLGGVVCYDAHCKVAILSVPPQTLRKYGEVSRPTSIALARGVVELTGADLGLAVTGIAGPAGGRAQKPVGTVHLAVHGMGRVLSLKRQLTGSREGIRRQASTLALDLVRRRLLETSRAPTHGGKT